MCTYIHVCKISVLQTNYLVKRETDRFPIRDVYASRTHGRISVGNGRNITYMKASCVPRGSPISPFLLLLAYRFVIDRERSGVAYIGGK